MIEECRRIAAAVDLPVTADLEAGYGNAAETVRRAIGVGIVGANIEDQLKPLAEATAQVEAIMAAADAEGVPDFVLNARTDAFVRAGDRDPIEVLADATERARAYLDAGAPVVFVPGKLDEDQIAHLVDALGPRRLTLIGVPGSGAAPRLCVWTVNDEDQMRAWFDRGVGYLTSDRPDLALSVRRRPTPDGLAPTRRPTVTSWRSDLDPFPRQGSRRGRNGWQLRGC